MKHNMKLIQHKLKKLLELNQLKVINNQKKNGYNNKQMVNMNIKFINKMVKLCMKIKQKKWVLDIQLKDQNIKNQ